MNELENIDWGDPAEAVYAANLMAADDIINDILDAYECVE